MKKIMAGLIGGVFFSGLFLGVAAASGDDDYYEHGGYGEYGEHGRYYGNPYYNGNGYYNNGYRNHEAYEYGSDDYRYRGAARNVYVNPYYNSGYYNGGYGNHEAYEYGGYRR